MHACCAMLTDLTIAMHVDCEDFVIFVAFFQPCWKNKHAAAHVAA